MELWGGRFNEEPSRVAVEFGASISVDRRLAHQDILGSLAHCRMLVATGIIRAEEGRTIASGLMRVLAEIDREEFVFRTAREDIHGNVEGRLHELIGDVAGKLHTARSRNDQVALDTRLWTREAVLILVGRALDVIATLLLQARRHCRTRMPAYTHLQRAQPVVLGHHLLAYVEMFRRDVRRLHDCFDTANVSPLGSGALAGVPYPIDRSMVARDLGMDGVTRNSMDAVSDRDYQVETIFACALLMTHLSRLAEEIVLWSTTEFGFVRLSDAFSTGSSIMPQKKNPDYAELIRGKAGRSIAQIVTILTVLKGTVLTYNKDFQEDKAALFDAVDTAAVSLAVLAPMMATAEFDEERLAAAAGEGFALATDYADHLAARGVPFRIAHHIVGRIVADCVTRGRRLTDLSLAELRAHAPEFDEDALQIDVASSLSARDVPGGTAPRQVEAALAETDEWLAGERIWLAGRQSALPTCAAIAALFD